MKTAYIIDILRTPIGKYGGTLASVRPDDLAAHVIKKLLERNPPINPESIEDVVFGAANQAGEDSRIAHGDIRLMKRKTNDRRRHYIVSHLLHS